jgi:hypothetical protein
MDLNFNYVTVCLTMFSVFKISLYTVEWQEV